MARYRKVDVRIWGDEKFRRLTPLAPSGQALWLYLLTGPHTTSVPGLFMAGEAMLAERLGWPMEAFQEAFQEGLREGLFEYDSDAHVISIPNAIRYNPPESPNVVRSWGPLLDEIPECDLKTSHIAMIYSFLKGYRKGFPRAFEEVFGGGLALSGTGTGTGKRKKSSSQDLLPGGCKGTHADFSLSPASRDSKVAGADAASIPRPTPPSGIGQPGDTSDATSGPGGAPVRPGCSTEGPGGREKQIHVQDHASGGSGVTPPGLLPPFPGSPEPATFSAGMVPATPPGRDAPCPARAAHLSESGGDSSSSDPGHRMVGLGCSLIPDNRPIGDEHDQLIELAQHHAELGGYPFDQHSISGSLRSRMLIALRKYGKETCKQVHANHVRESRKEGTLRKGFLAYAYPAEKNNHVLDCGKFWALAQLSSRRQSNRRPGR